MARRERAGASLTFDVVGGSAAATGSPEGGLPSPIGAGDAVLVSSGAACRP
jgi:hypothetical protein